MFRFREWFTANEMAARRSFQRSMGKYEPQAVTKPAATIAAWHSQLLDPSGHPYPEAIRRKLNDKANRKLAASIQRRGLSYYPVVGAGQEPDQYGVLTVNKENSLVVQPIGQMAEDEFLSHIRELLFNPTDEQGQG